MEPDARPACGEEAEPHARDDSRQPVEKPAGACGPSAPAFTRYESLEPSKINPRKDARASACEAPRYTPRTYKPPPVAPPEPMGAIVADKEAKMIFVFEGSRAYEAWLPVMRRKTRVACWKLTTTIVENGKQKRGWWFPSLFLAIGSTGPLEARRTIRRRSQGFQIVGRPWWHRRPTSAAQATGPRPCKRGIRKRLGQSQPLGPAFGN